MHRDPASGLGCYIPRRWCWFVTIFVLRIHQDSLKRNFVNDDSKKAAEFPRLFSFWRLFSNAGRMPALPAYVPVSQLDMYSSCSAVSVSIEIPKARSFRLAIS